VAVGRPPQGKHDFLSPEERQFVKRILSHPEDLPTELGSWLVDYLAVNGSKIPVSQIEGFSRYVARNQTVLTEESTPSTTYTDLATVGPSITGLATGQYQLQYGFMLGLVSNVTSALMAPSLNGSTPSDDEAARTRVTETGVSRATLLAIPEGSNNTVTMKYRQEGGTIGYFSNRWLLLTRIGN
jgi:hypothetical protein